MYVGAADGGGAGQQLGGLAASAEVQRLTSELAQKSSECEGLKTEVADLRQRVKKLTKMKATLSENVSSLYRTAVRPSL